MPILTVISYYFVLNTNLSLLFIFSNILIYKSN